jgi:hypothetical protein
MAHVFVHFEDGVVQRLESDVQEQAYLGPHEFAESQEKECMAAELACVSMFHAKKDVETVCWRRCWIAVYSNLRLPFDEAWNIT